MKKFIKNLGLVTNLTSGGITIYSFVSKKMTKQEIIQRCDEIMAKQEAKIKDIELQRQIDLSNLKNMNADCNSFTKQSMEFLEKAEIEASNYGKKAESFNYYNQKYKEANQKAIEIQERIDKYISDSKNSSDFIQE